MMICTIIIEIMRRVNHLLDELVNLINNVGFPIVCCVFMFQQNSTLSSTIMDVNRTLSNIDMKIEMLEKEMLYEQDKQNYRTAKTRREQEL